MVMQAIIPKAACVLCFCCGTAAVIFRPAVLASWLFLTGMLLLAGESALDYHVLVAANPSELGTWLRRSLILKSLVSGVWLGFSLVYARGNQNEFLYHWKWSLVAALLMPVVLMLGFPERVFKAAEGGNSIAIQLGTAG